MMNPKSVSTSKHMRLRPPCFDLGQLGIIPSNYDSVTISVAGVWLAFLMQTNTLFATASPLRDDVAPKSLLGTTPEEALPSLSEAQMAVDDPIEWTGFGRERLEEESGTWESYVAVQGMYCAACAITIENALTAVPGVQAASVSVAGNKAKVVWNAERTKPSEWMGAIAKAGYQAHPLSDAGSESARRADTRKALWRWLVAGLCMMQVMMYAYPSYVTTDLDLGVDAKTLLRWASWILSLPVLLFSSGPFFTKAFRELRLGIVCMELPIAIGIAMTFVVSTLGTFDPKGAFGREVYFDSLTMFVFFLLSGRLLELKLRDRVFHAIDGALHKMPETVERVELDGLVTKMSAKRVAVGDTLRVPAGQAFVADGLVTNGESLVNEAVLTGESEPLKRVAGQQVIAGSVNLTATLTMKVQTVGARTRVGEIMALMTQAQTSRPAFASLADRIAKPFLIGVLLLAAGTAIVWWPTDPERAMMAAVAVLIVTCPCALSLATPAALLSSVGAMAKQGILVKRLAALEALAKVDVVVFDKTGTLTSELGGLESIEVRDGISKELALALAAQMASQSFHPLSKALVRARMEMVASHGPDTWQVDTLQRLETAGAGIEATVQARQVHDSQGVEGEPQYQGFVKLGSALFCGVQALEKANAMVYLADQNGWLARFEIGQALRADARKTISGLAKQGLTLAIFSGDGQVSTDFIARQLGIERAYGQMQPADKLSALKVFHENGHRVAVVGDGINDALVLAAADVSVSLGSAVAVAQNQCDVLLQKGQLYDLVRARRQALATLTVIRQNLGWALIYNLVSVPMAAMGWLPAWGAGLGMALSSLLVIANAMRLTRSFSAIKGI